MCTLLLLLTLLLVQCTTSYLPSALLRSPVLAPLPPTSALQCMSSGDKFSPRSSKKGTSKRAQLKQSVAAALKKRTADKRRGGAAEDIEAAPSSPAEPDAPSPSLTILLAPLPNSFPPTRLDKHLAFLASDPSFPRSFFTGLADGDRIQVNRAVAKK
ncbi:hypothetical protein TeGR_g8277 [Tetraparma gracilis]|jgi:hypothetical protein|uniref:Uncharacterized protein n=1 Tax=Tetraparma gracilis TaxID=2962635 RepID=A0ABQ6N7F5_9STRA|nr:hypothetical protein TeGR_g8277 [Tetraparma gracilis]